MLKKGARIYSNSIMSSGLMQRTVSNSSKNSSCFDTLNEESDESDTNEDAELIQYSSNTRTTCTIVDNNRQKLIVDNEINTTFNMDAKDCDEYRLKSPPTASTTSTQQPTNAINQRRLYARSISFAGTRSSSTRLISSSTRRAIFFQRHDGRRLLPSVSCE